MTDTEHKIRERISNRRFDELRIKLWFRLGTQDLRDSVWDAVSTRAWSQFGGSRPRGWRAYRRFP